MQGTLKAKEKKGEEWSERDGEWGWPGGGGEWEKGSSNFHNQNGMTAI